MAVKQTAGRDQLGAFAPKFAELNDDHSQSAAMGRSDNRYEEGNREAWRALEEAYEAGNKSDG